MIDFIDVRREYIHAKACREVYVQLPPEDAHEGTCGKMPKFMYGTREAANNWKMSMLDSWRALDSKEEEHQHACSTMRPGT